MAKKLISLSAVDILLQADAATIREALERRIQIDELLAQRTAAYEQIEQLERQIEALVGEEGAFAYPAPPLPVAGFTKLTPAPRPAKPKPVSEEKPATAPDEKANASVESDEPRPTGGNE